MTEDKDIVFLEYSSSATEDFSIEKGVLPLPKAVSKLFRVSPENLSVRFNEFLNGLSAALRGIPEDLSGFHVDTVELSLAFDVKLGFAILAKGDAGMESGIRVVLKRSSSTDGT